MSRDILELPAPKADHRIHYGDHPYQFGDLRLPSGSGPHPTIIVIHGGCWQAEYDLEHVGHVCVALTEAGYATWSIEYRRIGNPGGGWPGTLLDVARAADYLRELAPQYHLDLQRVVTMGHSAGGQLAMWLAARHHIPEETTVFNRHPLQLAGAISLAGILDLQRAHKSNVCDGAVEQLIGGTPEQFPKRYAAASPARLLPLNVPQLLVHGTEDPIVPFSMSNDYHAAATGCGENVRLLALPGAGHFEVIDPRWSGWEQIRQAVNTSVNHTL